MWEMYLLDRELPFHDDFIFEVKLPQSWIVMSWWIGHFGIPPNEGETKTYVNKIGVNSPLQLQPW